MPLYQGRKSYFLEIKFNIYAVHRLTSSEPRHNTLLYAVKRAFVRIKQQKKILASAVACIYISHSQRIVYAERNFIHCFFKQFYILKLIFTAVNRRNKADRQLALDSLTFTLVQA